MFAGSSTVFGIVWLKASRTAPPLSTMSLFSSGTYNPFDETLVFHAILSPAILADAETNAADPHDVSEMEPWRSIRKDLAPCSIFKDLGEGSPGAG